VKSKMEVSHRGKALAKMLAYLKGESWV
jgi:inosine/xanthosine triphosphate pyrophosphatase family protein